jgi:hypothetical protein
MSYIHVDADGFITSEGEIIKVVDNEVWIKTENDFKVIYLTEGEMKIMRSRQNVQRDQRYN